MPSLRLVDSAWGKELLQALSQDSSALRIICPFIKLGAIDPSARPATE